MNLQRQFFTKVEVERKKYGAKLGFVTIKNTFSTASPNPPMPGLIRDSSKLPSPHIASPICVSPIPVQAKHATLAPTWHLQSRSNTFGRVVLELHMQGFLEPKVCDLHKWISENLVDCRVVRVGHLNFPLVGPSSPQQWEYDIVVRISVIQFPFQVGFD